MALAEPDFDEFDRGDAPDIELTTLTSYRGGLDLPGGVRAAASRRRRWPRCSPRRGERQLHVAETEKYAHVTYFFNGGREDEWEGEERGLVDSPARRRHLRRAGPR